MKYILLVLCLTACCSVTEPTPDVAELSGGWWYVTLSDGTVCIARPYMEPERDTPQEAIAECRGH